MTDYIHIFFSPNECCIPHQPQWGDALTQYLCEERKTQREAINNTIWSACWHKQSCINISHLLSTSHLHMNNYFSQHGYVHLMILESLPTGPLPRMGHRTSNPPGPHTQRPAIYRTICLLVLPPTEPYALLSYNLQGHITL